MESYTEAWLMLGIDALNEEARAELLQSHWRLCALLIHTYNIRHGLKCTGFDEDDPEHNLEEGIQNLPANFVEETREIMTFRYRSGQNLDEDFVMKIVP